MDQPVTNPRPGPDPDADPTVVVPEHSIGNWAQLMCTAVGGCDYPHMLAQLRGHCAGQDTNLLRAIFVSCAAVSAQAHAARPTHECQPVNTELWTLAEATPPPQGDARARDTAAAIDYLTRWYNCTTIDAVREVVHDWEGLTEPQHLAATAISAAYMRGELSYLTPSVGVLLSHTISRSPLPQAVFSHFYAALWATAVLEGNQPHEVAVADRLADFPAFVPRDLAWICLKTVASRMAPGTKAALPSEAVGCPCPDGISAAAMVSDWATAIAAGTPRAQDRFNSDFSRVLGSGIDLPKHVALASVYWMAYDWQHRGRNHDPL